MPAGLLPHPASLQKQVEKVLEYVDQGKKEGECPVLGPSSCVPGAAWRAPRSAAARACVRRGQPAAYRQQQSRRTRGCISRSPTHERVWLPPPQAPSWAAVASAGATAASLWSPPCFTMWRTTWPSPGVLATVPSVLGPHAVLATRVPWAKDWCAAPARSRSDHQWPVCLGDSSAWHRLRPAVPVRPALFILARAPLLCPPGMRSSGLFRSSSSSRRLMR